MKKDVVTGLVAVAMAACSGFQASAYETPTMGWSSWNTYRVNISADIICRQADAMAARGLKEAGYRYINIDDGFFGGRDANGRLLIHPTRFPDGLKPVADHIHSLGFKAGIYSDAGRNTCGNFWDKDAAGVGVGLYGHDDDDARFYFDEMGFDFIKIDFCGGDAKQNSEGLSLDERERYTAIRAAIDAVGRDDVRINVCRWAFPGTWVHSIGSSWRIAGDIGPSWGAIKRIINANNYLSAYAGQGHFNDMDMLEIGRGLSEAEERTHFGMWCIMSSPLLIGCDMTTIPERSLNLITNPELIALNQDPLGLQAHIVKNVSGTPTLYVKDILTLHGTTRAVAIYNHTESACEYTLNMADVDLEGRVEVRDLFAREDLPAVESGSMTVSVGAHDTAILRLEGERRVEQTVYEGETAWLERHQCLGINSNLGHATYSSDASMSGGVKVGWLGNHPDNYMEWRDVWSEEGGVYDMTIYYKNENRDIELTVNGGDAQTFRLASGNGTFTVSIVLAKGSNTIRIGNPNDWAPDIDKMTLLRTDDYTSIDAPAQPERAVRVRKVACADGVLRLPDSGTYSVWSMDGVRHAVRAGETEVRVTPGVYFLLPSE